MTDERQVTPRSLVAPFLLLVVCLFTWPAIWTFDAGDWPSPNQFPHNMPPHNACGAVGGFLAYYLRYLIGDGSYPLLLFVTLAAVLKLARGRVGSRQSPVGSLIERAIGLSLVVACTSVSVHLMSTRGSGSLPPGYGGLVGYALGELMTANLSLLGTWIILASSFFVGLLFTTEGWVLRLPGLVARVGEATASAAVRSGSAFSVARHAVTAARAKVAIEGVSTDERYALFDHEDDGADDEDSVDDADDGTDSDALIVKPGKQKRRETRKQRRKSKARRAAESREDDAEAESTSPVDAPESVDSEEDVPDHDASSRRTKREKKRGNEKKRRELIVNHPNQRDEADDEPYPAQIENWILPSLDLLDRPEYSLSAQHEVLVREQAKVLESTLEEFRLNARVVEIDTGPVITMFELKLGAGIKVSQIVSLSNDIARALKSHAIRVVAPISGKNTVGIEVPNLQKEVVHLRELMTVAGKPAAKMALPLFVGKDAGGAPLVTDLSRMPHALIAGTTGSGKSVCINSMILSLLMTKRPDHVKMILIDPKMVELSQFKDVPHLMCPIVTDVNRAEKILEWAVATMEERYALLAEARVKNIASYNHLGADELYKRLSPTTDDERARIPARIPYIVIIIDELADLMMTSPKEVEHNLSRLAQKSRAVGVHIIVATQRPEAKVVTGLIKSNLPSRICFRVASRMDSRIVLDQNGGEVLMGQGDMLFLPPGSHKLLRAQGTYLSDDEVQAVLDDLADRSKPEFHPALMRIKTPGSDEASEFRDPLFDDAVRIILESRRGSVSLLQRRLTIGYSRASRLIDQMADAGLVGDYKASQAREVLMTLDEWESFRASVAKDIADHDEDSEAMGFDELEDTSVESADDEDESSE